MASNARIARSRCLRRYALLNLRDLQCFVVVAQEGHVTRAAARLAMQQPHLSRLLRRLEADLGVPLLKRGARGVECTPAGKALTAEATRILTLADEMPRHVLRAACGESGRLAVGLTSSAALHPSISRAVRSFRESYEAVALTLEEAGTGDLIARLEQGSIDTALVRTPVHDRDVFRVERVLSEPMVVALPAGHKLARTPTAVIRLEDLASEAFVLYRRATGPGFYDTIIAACQGAGFSPRISQEAPRLTATLGLVAAGLGISIVPASMRILHLDGLVVRNLRGTSDLEAIIDLVSRKDAACPVLDRFVEVIRNVARDAR